MAQDNGPDPAALAALRPGMPAAGVAAAMGASWRAPAAHAGGFVDVLQNSHGLLVRLDRDGAIGWVQFDWRFKHAAVEGLAMDMSLAEAQAAAPALAVGGDLPMMTGVREGRQALPGGAELCVRFTLDTVNDMRIEAPGAVFIERSAPPYPAPEGRAGAPFADANFKLVVLSALLDAKALDLGTPEILAAHLLGRPVDLWEEGYEPIPEARDYLARYPLTEALLAQVRRIVFDGGNAIYPFIHNFWDGEDGAFDVADLGGIASCTELTGLDAGSMIGPIDARQLAALRRLESLNACTGLAHPEALRDLSGLRQLRVLDDRLHEEAMTPGHPTRAVLKDLKARGVAVRVDPFCIFDDGTYRPFE